MQSVDSGIMHFVLSSSQISSISLVAAKEYFNNCEKNSKKDLSAPCATNRLSYEFMDDLEQLGGTTTFKRIPSEGDKRT